MRTLIRFCVVVPALAAAVVLVTAESKGFGAQGTDLDWKLKAGSSARYESSSKTEIIQSVFGMESKISSNERTVLRRETKDVAEGKVAREDTLESMALELNHGEGPIKWDSEIDDPMLLEEHPWLRGFAEAMGKGFTYTISQEGKVGDMTGYSAIRDVILRHLGGEMRTSLEPVLSDEAAIAGIESQWAMVPRKAVGTGDTWKIETFEFLPGIGRLDYAYTYRMEGAHSVEGRSVARVSFTAELKFTRVRDGQFAEWEVEFSNATCRGSYEFDLKLGDVTDVEQVLVFDMKMTGEVEGMQIELSQRQTRTTRVRRLPEEPARQKEEEKAEEEEEEVEEDFSFPEPSRLD